jgi:putative transposase
MSPPSQTSPIESGRIRSVPSRLRRYQQAKDLHFITFSCYGRKPKLGTPAARDLFERSLEKVRQKYGLYVTGYVVMPEHVHLLINEPPRILLAQFLKAVKQTTSRRLKGEQEKFWQERYYNSNVRGEAARTQVIRYIHRNRFAKPGREA